MFHEFAQRSRIEPTLLGLAQHLAEPSPEKLHSFEPAALVGTGRKAWMRGASDELPPELATAETIDAELKRVLAGHDDFWPRWVLWQRGIDAP